MERNLLDARKFLAIEEPGGRMARKFLKERKNSLY